MAASLAEWGVAVAEGDLTLRYRGGERRVPSSDSVVIGSAPDCDLRVASSSAAHHCRVRHDGRRWVVEDLGSAQGTQVAGRRVGGRMALVGEGEIVLGSGADPVRVGFVAPASAMAWDPRWVAGGVVAVLAAVAIVLSVRDGDVDPVGADPPVITSTTAPTAQAPPPETTTSVGTTTTGTTSTPPTVAAGELCPADVPFDTWTGVSRVGVALPDVATPDGREQILGGVVQFTQVLGEAAGYASLEAARSTFVEGLQTILNVEAGARRRIIVFERGDRFFVFEAVAPYVLIPEDVQDAVIVETGACRLREAEGTVTAWGTFVIAGSVFTDTKWYFYVNGGGTGEFTEIPR